MVICLFLKNQILVKIEVPEDAIGVKDFFQLGNVLFEKDDVPFALFQSFRQVIYELKSFRIFAPEFFEGKVIHLNPPPFGFDDELQEVPVLTRRCLGRLYAVLLRPVSFCLKEVLPDQMEWHR